MLPRWKSRLAGRNCCATPAFLEWGELLAEAGQMQPAATVSPQQQVLVADLANQFFTDLFGSIDRVAAMRGKDDQKIILFNRIIDHARCNGAARILSTCRQLGLGKQAVGRVLKTIAWYRQKIESDEFTGAAVARGYRKFLLQPGGRGAHAFSRVRRSFVRIASKALFAIGMLRDTSHPQSSSSKWSDLHVHGQTSRSLT